MARHGDMIGLVELADAESLLDRHGKATFKELQNIFHKRLQGWVRSMDEWRRLDDDRTLRLRFIAGSVPNGIGYCVRAGHAGSDRLGVYDAMAAAQGDMHRDIFY